jgi:hypothetical protein
MEFDEELNRSGKNIINIEDTSRIIRELIEAVGEDPEREGLKNTPDRVARMYTELLSGYTAEPERIINGALFDITYDEMVIVRDIEFYSLCEHHMLPFIGRAHIAYIPAGKVIGLVQNSAHRGYVRPPFANSGTHDAPDRGFCSKRSQAARRGSCRRGDAHVRDDARRKKTRRAHDHLRHARSLPRELGDAAGIFG